MSSTIDLAICIFSPVSDAEIARAVRPSGFYLEVGPAARHLWELKTALYEQPREHASLRRTIPDGELLREGECHYEKQLNNAELLALVAATPFAFRGYREKREALQERSDLTISLGFSWRLFKLADWQDAPVSRADSDGALESNGL